MTLRPREAAVELGAIVAGITVAWIVTRWFLYPALGLPDNVPMILRPITGFLLAWWLLRRRGEGWSAVGLRRPDSIAWAIAVAVLLYLAQMALSRWVVLVLAQAIPPQPQGAPFLLYIRGNPGAFALWLSIGWIVGGFMEELLFRGFLITRIASLLPNRAAGLALGIVLQAALFGLLHLYGGAFAMLHAGVFALASGVFYLLARRNLWPLILVHGAVNTQAMISLYGA